VAYPPPASSTPVILAVDLGTSGLRVALITTQGQILGWEAQPIKLYLTPGGGAEQSPEEWWQAFLSAVGRLLARNLTTTHSIRAVCCSTQGEGTIPVDRDGKPLTNCFLWMDMRAAPYLRNQVRGLVNLDGVDIFKIFNWVRLTGGLPSMTGKDPAGHMLFVRDTLPDVYARTHKFLNVLDYMNLRLTGEWVASADSIVTSWVTDNRTPGQLTYSERLIRYLGIDHAKLPDIVPCTTVIGKLRAEIAQALGLDASVQVVAGSIDNTAAAIGAGAVQDYVPHLYLGTSSWLAAHVPFKKTDVLASLASIPCALPNRYLLTALQATAGGNLTFLRDNILYYQDGLTQAANAPDAFKIMDNIAEHVPAGANGVIYAPWIWGERAPVDDRALRAGLYNLSLNNTRADIIRAFLEGVALNTRWLMQPFAKFIGRTVERVHLVGGGGNSDVWCQIMADVLNVEIRQVQDPIQSNARGAAWIAAVGLGEITFDDVPALVQFKRTYAPTAEHRALYDDRFAVFTQIYRQMKGIYRHLNP